MRLSPAHYRHPAEVPALIASLGLVITVLLLIEGGMIYLLVLLFAREMLAAAIADLAVLLLCNLDIAWALIWIASTQSALRQGATHAGPEEYREVHAAAVHVAERLGMPATPPVYVLREERPSSCVIGTRHRALLVATGLVEALSEHELQAALARQMAHIKGHSGLLNTLILYPACAEAIPWWVAPVFELLDLLTRWWRRAAECSADRAATIALGCPEPVARALATVVNTEAGSEVISGEDVAHYLPGATDPRPVAKLARTRPEIERRLSAIGRFAASEKFRNCQAIVGDAGMAPQRYVRDRERVGPLPYLIISALAVLYMIPLSYLLALAISAGADRYEEPKTPTLSVLPGERQPAEPQPGVEPPADSSEVTVQPAEPEPEEPTGAAVEPQTVAPDVEEGMLELGRMHKKRKEYDKARRVLMDLIKLNPTNVEGHYVLAWVCAESGDNRTARMEFTAVTNLAAPGTEMYKQAQAALERLGSE